jgi:hypothetical protein
MRQNMGPSHGARSHAAAQGLTREWLVSLPDGEQQRRQNEYDDRERRERAEDERAQLQMMKAMRF